MAVSRKRRGVLERTIEGLLDAIDRDVSAEATARHMGLLQRFDPRVKLAGLLSLVVAVTVSRRADVLAALLALAIVLAVLSRLPVGAVMSRVWVGTFGFTAALALPALVLTPGRSLFRLPWLDWPITAQGIATAGYLVLRTETAATLGVLLIFTTPWAHLLKALRAFRVPVVFVVVLGMTYRYILLLLETAHAMFEARRSRTVGRPGVGARRRLAVQSAGVLLVTTLDLSGEVFLAMQARGFRGEVFVLDDFRMTGADWIALTSLVGTALLACWKGR
jgi:cobalt/nickel transport system permease protein